MGLEYQVCYNGGAQWGKCKQRRLSQQETAIGATHLCRLRWGENLKKKKKKNSLEKYMLKLQELSYHYLKYMTNYYSGNFRTYLKILSIMCSCCRKNTKLKPFAILYKVTPKPASPKMDISFNLHRQRNSKCQDQEAGHNSDVLFITSKYTV